MGRILSPMQIALLLLGGLSVMSLGVFLAFWVAK